MRPRNVGSSVHSCVPSAYSSARRPVGTSSTCQINESILRHQQDNKVGKVTPTLFIKHKITDRIWFYMEIKRLIALEHADFFVMVDKALVVCSNFGKKKRKSQQEMLLSPIIDD